MNCLEVVAQRKEQIYKIIDNIQTYFHIQVFRTFIWKSRAIGNCRIDSDIDIFLQVDKSVDVSNLDQVNAYLRQTNQHYVGNVSLDMRFGHGTPVSQYIDIRDFSETISFPQSNILSGKNIFDLKLNDKLKVTQFMISVPPYNMVTGYWYDFYRNKVDKRNYSERVELLFGVPPMSHDEIHVAYGTQPFGSYLRGHIYNNGFVSDKIRNYPFETKENVIIIQQYYKSNLRPNINYLDTQVKMNKVGFMNLVDTAVMQKDDLIYFENHSHNWDEYICNPFYAITVCDWCKLFSLPLYELTKRWKVFADYGITHTDFTKLEKSMDVVGVSSASK